MSAGERVPSTESAQREIEDLWWLLHSLEALIEGRKDGDHIRIGILHSVLATTRPETSTTDPRLVERLPDCEGWTCQSCAADNFIPPGFVRLTSSAPVSHPPDVRTDVEDGPE